MYLTIYSFNKYRELAYTKYIIFKYLICINRTDTQFYLIDDFKLIT